MDIEKWGFGQGGYVFLSHSHQDISKVRMIRNYLEEQGFEPLCFYLKCLEKDSEIFNLIEREIAAREWFVYLKSINAEKSEWVQRELNSAEHLGKVIIKIDLDKELSAKKISDSIACSMRVFFSYSHKDQILAKKISDYMISKDLKVFIDLDIELGVSFREQIAGMIVEAANNGCVIVLITENSINNEYVLNELEYAIAEKATVLPIVIGDIELPPVFFFLLANIRWLKFQNANEIDMQKIYSVTKRLLLDKLYKT